MKALKNRIEERQQAIEAQIVALTVDVREHGEDERQRLRGKLAELQSYLANGWSHLDAPVVAHLDEWLKR